MSLKSNAADSVPWYKQGYVRLLGRVIEELGRKVSENKTAISNLIFPKRIMDLIEEIKLWRTSKQWYKDRCIPWKRGWLLYGPPGTGKTALARSAKALRLKTGR